MKRRSASLCGNFFMGLGLLVMVLGFAVAVLNQIPQFSFSSVVASGAVFAIFVGAVVWLAGARIGGHEQISDRYFWVRHFDKRCRRDQP